MRIMFNTMGLGKGGAERVINILSNSLIKNNNIKIVTNINTEIAYDFDNKIEITSLEKKTYKRNKISKLLGRISIFKIINLKKIILNYNPDIIISFLPEPCFRILFLKKISNKIKKIPIIISVRNDPQIEYKNPIYFNIMKNLYPLANNIILQTSDSKKYFEEKINYSGIIIYNPVDDRFLKPRYNGIRKKEIVAVGRLEKQKNYKMLIDAFEIVAKKHKDYILKIYGEGKLKKEIVNYIKEKELDKFIMLKGQINNIKKEIFKASIFVMTSNYEGMPNSLLEAACLGIPCISTDCPCGGPKEILKNGENGILVEVNDFIELGEKINYMIENPIEASIYGKKANKSAKKYSSLVIVKKWEEVIKKEVYKIQRNDF